MNLIVTTPSEGRMRTVTDSPNAEELVRFVERFALMLVESGVPRMPARVFGALLIAEDGKRTAGELAELLRVRWRRPGLVRYMTDARVRNTGPGCDRQAWGKYFCS